MAKKTKRSKFRNIAIVNDEGIRFDSKKEMARYEELRKMEKQGLIWNLRRQVRFVLLPSIYEDVPVQLKRKVSTKRKSLFRETAYVADFVYTQDDKEVVEDVKASADFQDRVYKIKKKLMYMIHNVKIKETYK